MLSSYMIARLLSYKYTRNNIGQKLMNAIPMAIKCQETGTVHKCLWKESAHFFAEANKKMQFFQRGI